MFLEHPMLRDFELLLNLLSPLSFPALAHPGIPGTYSLHTNSAVFHPGQTITTLYTYLLTHPSFGLWARADL